MTSLVLRAAVQTVAPWSVRPRSSLALVAVLAQLACSGPAPDPMPEDDGPKRPRIQGMAPPAVRGLPSVVELRPEGGDTGETEARPVTMDQLGLQFSPRFVTVRVGQTVVFTNSETLSHNVHVTAVDGGETLLNADTEPSSQVELRLDQPGGYHVGCDTHPGMTGLIYAGTGPYAAFAEQDGRFSLEGVPPGRYVLTVWSADPGLRSERVIDAGPETTEIEPSGGSRPLSPLTASSDR